MEHDKLSWLRGPVPPLSESILMSGLVPRSTKAPGGNGNQFNQQNVFKSNSSMGSQKKPSKPVISYKKPDEITQIMQKSTPIIPQPYINQTYKPQPIESIAEAPQRVDIPKNTREETIKVGETQRKNMKEDIARITQDLDSNIASLMVFSPESLTTEQTVNLKSQMLHFHNFAFNQLILQEKSFCSDRALFLRRLENFYNQLVQELPQLITKFSAKYEELKEEVEYYKKCAEESDKLSHQNDQEIVDLKEIIESLKVELAQTVKESNEKDVIISSTSYDLEYAQGQINNLEFKLQEKKDLKKQLENAIESRDLEIRRQLAQIEVLNTTVHDYQNGETGYIVLYHDEIKEKEKALEKIKELEEKIVELTTIPKEDKCVDTSDIPTKKGKKKKISNQSSISNETHISAESSSREGIETQNSQPKIIQNMSNFRNLIQRRGRGIIGQNSTSSNISMTTDMESQTDPIEPVIVEKIVQKIVEVPKIIRISSDITEEVDEETYEERQEDMELNEHPISIMDMEFDNPTNYTHQQEDFDAMPSLRGLVVPFFCMPYQIPCPSEPKVLNVQNVVTIVNNEKPLVWGLQQIHNMLCDPFMRSTEAHNHNSFEGIVVEWFTRNLKLQHLVTQTIADITFVIDKYQTYDQIIDLFVELIDGQYSFTQTCFLGILYTFSNNFTYPNYPNMLKNLEVKPNMGSICIHAQAAFCVLEKCFTSEMANAFVRKMIPEEGSPMIPYVKFLREAMVFFADKHKMVTSQTFDLLWLCGCVDKKTITFDTFEYFMMLLNFKGNLHVEWKKLLQKQENKSAQCIQPVELLNLCADKGEPFSQLFTIPTLIPTVQKLQSEGALIMDLYRSLMNRVTKLLPYILNRSSETIQIVTDPLIRKMRQKILLADFNTTLVTYKKTLLKIEQMTIDEKGGIPFNIHSNQATINLLTEYLDKSEQVSFALYAE